jgi:hypothetical protein
MPLRPARDHMRVTEGGRHVELGVRHRPFPEHRVVRIEHLGLAPLAGEHRKRPTHPVHPVPLGQPSTTPVTALCGHSRCPGRGSTTSRLATQPVWSRGARDSRLAIRSPRRHFAADRHRRTAVHRRAPRSVQFPQAAEPFWNEATQVRPGQPVNAERTNRRPMGHVLPRCLSHVSGNQFVQKAFGEVLHPFRSMSEESAFFSMLSARRRLAQAVRRADARPVEAASQSLQVLPCGSSRTPFNLATTPPVGGRTCSLCSLRRPRSESPDGSQRLGEPPPLAHSSSRPEGGSHTRHGHNGAKSVNVSRGTGR